MFQAIKGRFKIRPLMIQVVELQQLTGNGMEFKKKITRQFSHACIKKETDWSVGL